MEGISPALLWLASGVQRRTALRFFFNVWYLSDSPAGRLARAQESVSLSTVPFEVAPGVFCLGTVSQAQRRAQAQSRLAELLSAWRVSRVRLLRKVIIQWHSTVLWTQHCIETRELARSVPEPEKEPLTRPRTALHDMFRDLRALFCLVRFLGHASIRSIRCTYSTALFQVSTAQTRCRGAGTALRLQRREEFATLQAGKLERQR